MPAETVDTYTHKPTERSVFTPSPEDKTKVPPAERVPDNKKSTGFNVPQPVK